MARDSKKQKTSESLSEVQASRSIKACYITKLPLELLAEILLYTKSPKDILALTRCSKFFCRTLLHQANQYIWRYARQNCLPEALPEPCSRFTESSFAAFVLDAGPCEICGRLAGFYSSFGLRTRCKSAIEQDKLHISKDHLSKDTYHIFEGTLPVVESSASFAGIAGGHGEWPDISLMYRKSDWACALQDYLDVSQSPAKLEQFITLCSRKSAETKLYMQMCVGLQSWKRKHLEAQTTTENVNTKISKDLAVKEGLDFWDMMNTPTYRSLFKQKNASLELIQQFDYKIREVDITAELLKVAERRSRRAHETGYSTCRQAVEKHYNRLRALKQESPLPCLPSFRKLPTIHQIQHSTSQSKKELDNALQSQPIRALVHSELEKFHSDAKNALAAIMGFSDWKSPSSRKLHPADRLTARFRCRTCQRVEAKYKDCGSLDYEGAIMHLCSVTLDEPVSPMPFKAERFEKDTKAIAAISALLEVCGIPDDQKGSHRRLSAIGPRIVCLSCDAQIVMEPLDVIGHSHRHESMSLAILPQDEANQILGAHPPSYGLAAKLTSKGKIALEMRKMKIYLCRHCVQVKPQSTPMPATGRASEHTDTGVNDSASTQTATMTPNADSASQKFPKVRQPTLYVFDGLRSHLKGLHKISSVRDEDFICTQDLPWPKR
ncbi:hypothetical protein F5890DRAFT_1552800 [Lentinula detonsa]|uniref:F-box domain-containing protein n=1 Tax=Lentinula detonsa TaxID=2804962 RepID=A0AA38Q1T8_9AGAR|nr:hypothetical protein F5890DRAFT_1552800 [Lentinula detonsa]